MVENWRDIPGYEGRYKASNLGRIKSLGNDKLRKEKILKGTHSGDYKKVALFNDGKRRFFWVHRLVWEAFNGKIQEGMVINHKDENPANNNLENLEVVTQKENANWGTRTERIKRKRRDLFLKKIKDLGFNSVKEYKNYCARVYYHKNKDKMRIYYKANRESILEKIRVKRQAQESVAR